MNVDNMMDGHWPFGCLQFDIRNSVHKNLEKCIRKKLVLFLNERIRYTCGEK